MRKTILIAVALISLQLQAQDQVVFKAMTDEMNRNLELLERDENKPFYISYALSTSKVQSVSAVFGSITNADESTVKGWNSRVMVGNYKINDENYSDDQDFDVAYLSYPAIPLGEDYLAIRRFFWIATNNIFEEAARLYESKKENLKRHEIEYDVPDFDKVAPTQLYLENEVTLVDLDEVRSFVSRLSKEFSAHAEVIRSGVNWSSVSSSIFFKNSEGTEYQIPYNLNVVTISADILDEEGIFHNDNFEIVMKSPRALVDNYDLVKNQIGELINNVKRKSKSTSSIDSYYGPVLLVGELSASFFRQNLMTGSKGITGYRDILNMQNKQHSINYFKEFKKASEADERVADSNLNVYALPKATSYNGLPLMGTVIIDGEGVVPPDTVHLVENGLVKERLNSRTPIPKGMKSNGHNLNFIYNGNLSKNVSPSNLLIDYDVKLSVAKLKEKLIEKVKEDGLEYGLMLRPAYEGSNRLIEVVKLYESGSEEIEISTIPNLAQNSILRRILATSDDFAVVNNPGSAGTVFRLESVISASHVLVDGFEINFSDPIYNSYLPSIPMPKRN